MKHPEQAIIVQVHNQKALMDTAICSAGLAAFAYLIIYPLPLKAAAYIPLALSAFIISRNICRPLPSPVILFRDLVSPKMLLYNMIGVQMGIAGAMYYRGSYGMPVLPALINGFALVAVAIGIMEELVFRGFIQGRLSRLHPGFAILFTAFANATYKACLFLSPAAQQHQHLLLFYAWSFGVFILLGIVRHYSKSIVPAIIVHAIFDLLVYAENLQAPWWVW